MNSKHPVLSPWNPASYLRLLWLVFVVQEYPFPRAFEEIKEPKVGSVLVSILSWLPLLLVTTALALGRLSMAREVFILRATRGQSMVVGWRESHVWSATTILVLVAIGVFGWLGSRSSESVGSTPYAGMIIGSLLAIGSGAMVGTIGVLDIKAFSVAVIGALLPVFVLASVVAMGIGESLAVFLCLSAVVGWLGGGPIEIGLVVAVYTFFMIARLSVPYNVFRQTATSTALASGVTYLLMGMPQLSLFRRLLVVSAGLVTPLLMTKIAAGSNERQADGGANPWSFLQFLLMIFSYSALIWICFVRGAKAL